MEPPSFPPAQPDRSSEIPSLPLGSPSFDATDEMDINQSFHELEQSFQLLKTRHAQVQADRQRQQNLRDRKEQLEQQLQHTTSSRLQHQLKQDLKQIRQQLDQVEVALESQLFSWNGLKEVFWQAIRFGGLGMVAGWVLRSMVR